MIANIMDLIDEKFKELGYSKNLNNKKIVDDFHNKYYSINKITTNPDLGNHIGSYTIEISIGYDCIKSEDFAFNQSQLDLVVNKLIDLERLLKFNYITLEPVSKNPKRQIGNISLLIDNYSC